MKRNPSMWSVKAGSRSKASYLGPDARAKAEAFARANFGEFTVKELPPLRRKQWSKELMPAE